MVDGRIIQNLILQKELEITEWIHLAQFMAQRKLGNEPSALVRHK
jgi:hypothetical protein